MGKESIVGMVMNLAAGKNVERCATITPNVIDGTTTMLIKSVLCTIAVLSEPKKEILLA